MDRFNMFNDNGYYEPDETFYKMELINGTYKVQPGDNLNKIANEFGTTVDELIRLNKLTTTTIYPGQVLIIPEPEETSISYLVKPGDNLYQIAKKYNTSVDEIMMINNLESNLIFPNQMLLIPYNENEYGMYYKEYITIEGDTLGSIANKFNTTSDKILMYNDVLKLKLAPNQMINLPNSRYSEYVIKENDTLEIILEKTKLSLEELVELNKDVWLKQGNEITIR